MRILSEFLHLFVQLLHAVITVALMVPAPMLIFGAFFFDGATLASSNWHNNLLALLVGISMAAASVVSGKAFLKKYLGINL